jgi:hypothetical protein
MAAGRFSEFLILVGWPYREEPVDLLIAEMSRHVIHVDPPPLERIASHNSFRT